MDGSRIITRGLRCSALVLVAALGVGGVQAWPGDRIERHAFPASTSFRLLDMEPSVASDVDGNFVVVWWSWATGVYPEEGIWARRFDRHGVPREDQIRVSRPLGGLRRDESPAVAMDADGDFVVVWVENNSGSSDRAIFGQRFNKAGEAAGSAFRVNDPSLVPSFDDPAVAMDADGDFVVVWSANDPDPNHVSTFAQRYSASGAAQGSAFPVNQSAASTRSPTVAMSGAGDFVVIWHGAEAGFPGEARGRRFGADGTAQGDEFVVSHSGPGFVAGAVAAAMDASGDFVAAFVRFVDSESRGSVSAGIFARRFDALGEPRGEEFQVSEPGHVQFRGEINAAMDTDGDFVVAWIANQSFLGGDTSLHTRLFDAAGMPVTKELKLEFTASREASVAMDAQGNFVAAWQQPGPNPDGSGSGPNIFAQRFAGPDDRRAGCGGYVATHAGTNDDDVINASVGEDVIQARGGHDVVMAGAGNDIVCGGRGNDQLFGEDGSDRLSGGPEDDVLDGGAGHDFCNRQTRVNADTVVDCEEIKISIDIQPPDKHNVVDLKDPNSRVRVALLSDAAFDALQVDIATVRFGPAAAAVRSHWTRDVDHDGIADLVVVFKTTDTGIGCNVRRASLTAQTHAGLGALATDWLRTSCASAP